MEKKAGLAPCCYKNLLKAVDICTYAGIELNYDNLSEDQADGLEYAVRRLKSNEQEILYLRYGEGMSFRMIGERKGISAARAGQIHAGAVWKLRQPSYYVWYVEGLEVHYARREAGAERLRLRQQKSESTGMLERSCMKIGIPLNSSHVWCITFGSLYCVSACINLGSAIVAIIIKVILTAANNLNLICFFMLVSP